MIICLDIYLEIINLSDLKTSFNMLCINKKLHSEIFFKRCMQKKYPLLSRENLETWKELFIRTTYYLIRLEKIGIPYIPHKNFIPERFYKTDRVLQFNAMTMALDCRNIKIVKHLMQNYTYDYDWLMYHAAEFGFIDAIKFFIEKGAKNFNTGLYYSARGGNLDMVKLMLKNSDLAENLILSIDIAKRYGFDDVAEYLENQLTKKS